MSKNLKITIADVSISIEGDVQRGDEEIVPAYGPFIGPGKTDVRLRLHQGLPDTLIGEKAFDCPPIWSLYRENGTSVIKIYHQFSGLERTLVLPCALEKADLYFADKSGRFIRLRQNTPQLAAGMNGGANRVEARQGEDGLASAQFRFDTPQLAAGSFIDPFYGPTMELLMVNYLAQGSGVIIHSCGIAMNGRGILFVGESGAGKSTLAKMWNQESGVDVLSDDRIIVRKKGHQFWMYGTPWHGDARLASPRRVRLESIFFLRHGQNNSIKEIKGIDPVSQLLTSSFPPYWDPQGMAFTLEVFTDLTAHVPCQELAFKPERSALDLVIEELRD